MEVRGKMRELEPNGEPARVKMPSSAFRQHRAANRVSLFFRIALESLSAADADALKKIPSRWRDERRQKGWTMRKVNAGFASFVFRQIRVIKSFICRNRIKITLPSTYA